MRKQTAMRRKIVAANWKMNGSTELVHDLVGKLRSGLGALDNAAEVVIMPPAVYIGAVQDTLADAQVAVGLQNVARFSSGAYTGEIAASMAADVGCRYALVGHSERRQLFGESDDVVAEKAALVLEEGLTLILCVGETLEERERGDAEKVVCSQVAAGLARVAAGHTESLVIAYEPVWAIGTGQTATTEDAQAMHGAIRRKLEELDFPAEEISLLYGGSVKPDNAAALFSQPDIDGGLVGGASLSADDFLEICRAAGL